MILNLNILKKSDKLETDNRLISSQEIKEKLNEESQEVKTAISDYEEHATLDNLREIIKETFDVIQICILILWRCSRKAKEVGKDLLVHSECIEHRQKLAERGWEIEKEIEVNIKE